MMDEGLLVYGITDLSDNNVLSTCTGVHGAPVNLIRAGSIAAIISAFPLKDSSLNFKEDRLTWHYLLDTIHKKATVLPARFGLVASNPQEVRSLLELGGKSLEQRLSLLKDKGEYDVTISWNPQTQIEQIVRENEQIRQLRTRTSVTQEEKIIVGRLIFQAIEARRVELKDHFMDALLELATEHRELRYTENDVLSSAFLVDKARFSDFEARIYQIGNESADGLRCRYSGPMPTYSFVGLTLVVLTQDRVEQARKLLNIQDRVSIQQIKATYRRAARECHPDYHPDDPEASKRFQELTNAFQCLLGLASSYDVNEKTPFDLKYESGQSRVVPVMEEQ